MSIGLAVSRSAALLGIFAAVTTGLIAWTWAATKDDIAASVRAAESRQLLEIFPERSHDNALLDDFFPVAADTALLELREARRGYRARENGDTVGVILPATARDGYSGDISLLVGVERDGSIAGVRVVAHRETPGLGDAIELRKSDWIRDFKGKSLGKPAAEQWQVKKDGGEFDQFTGATITPRAVVTAVRKTLEYAEQHHKTLFADSSPEAIDP